MPRSVRRPMLIGSATPGGRRVIRPDCSSVGGSSFIIASAVVVFPHPDSPARPSASPAVDREVDPVDDRVLAVADAQVLDLEQVGAGNHQRSSRSRGLTNSSSR